jgi:hypothetical protein
MYMAKLGNYFYSVQLLHTSHIGHKRGKKHIGCTIAIAGARVHEQLLSKNSFRTCRLTI